MKTRLTSAHLEIKQKQEGAVYSWWSYGTLGCGSCSSIELQSFRRTSYLILTGKLKYIKCLVTLLKNYLLLF